MLKSVFTLGPSSHTEEIISSLLEQADRFRLNASHINSEELFQWLKKIELIFQKNGKKIPVIIDLQGAKMRIGNIEKKEFLPKHIVIYYSEKNSVDKNSIFTQWEGLSDIFEIPTPHKPLFGELNVGELISLNDNRVIVKVLKKNEDSFLCEIIQNGPLSSKKGINRVEHPVFYREITNSDREAIEIALKFDFTQFAFSFTLTGYERELFKNINKHFIAKIERDDAFENLDTIDKNFDEIWLCRGDLGAQVGLKNLATVCKTFALKMKTLKKDIFLAGEIFEHLTISEAPTRAEIVALGYAKDEGYKGVVFSNETAIGVNPEKVAYWWNLLK